VHRPITGHTPAAARGILESSPEQTGTDNQNHTYTKEFIMSNTIFGRYLAYLFIGGAMVGSAALGLAGMADAATQPANPGFNAPGVTAHPAPNATPGWHNHHGQHHIDNLVHNGFHR
jgi:hypothetical protein